MYVYMYTCIYVNEQRQLNSWPSPIVQQFFKIHQEKPEAPGNNEENGSEAIECSTEWMLSFRHMLPIHAQCLSLSMQRPQNGDGVQDLYLPPRTPSRGTPMSKCPWWKLFEADGGNKLPFYKGLAALNGNGNWYGWWAVHTYTYTLRCCKKSNSNALFGLCELFVRYSLKNLSGRFNGFRVLNSNSECYGSWALLWYTQVPQSPKCYSYSAVHIMSTHYCTSVA